MDIFTPRFITAIRESSDEEYVFHVLRKLPEFQGRTDEELKDELPLMSYECCETNRVLFSQGEAAQCWYYILSGSVLMHGTFYPAGERLGLDDRQTHNRQHECLILDPTELLKINFEADQPCVLPSDSDSLEYVDGPSPDPCSDRRESTVSLTGSVNSEDILCQRSHESHSSVPRPFSDPSIPDSLKMEDRGLPLSSTNLASQTIQSLRSRTLSSESLDKALQNPVTVDRVPSPLSGGTSAQRHSLSQRGSSVFDDDTTLSESHVDSDDDDDQSEESDNSIGGMDHLVEVLSKSPQQRTEEDLDKIQEFANLLPALSQFTANVRRSLLKVMVLSPTVEQDGTVIIKDCDEVETWYIVLNGDVKWSRTTGVQATYHVGDSFGISGNQRAYHQSGQVVASKDCQYASVPLDVYGRVLTEGQENLIKVRNEVGEVEMVLEKRMSESRTQKREGYFVVEATPERLLDHLLEESVDDNYHMDFLLTYRTFLKSPDPIIEKLLKAWNERVDQRKRVMKIMLHWVGHHFADFDTDDTQMIRFLDQFEEYCRADNNEEAQRFIEGSRTTLGRTRIIDIEREQTVSEKSSIGFEIDGCGYRGDRIFVTAVDADSLARERGVRVGDELLAVNEKESRNNDLESMKKGLRNTYRFTLRVKSNIPDYRRFVQMPKAERRQRAQTSPKLTNIRTNIPSEMLEKRKSTGNMPSGPPMSPTRGAPVTLSDTMKKSAQKAYGKIKDKMGTLSKPKKRARRAGSQPIASEIFQKETSGRSKDDSAIDSASSSSNLKKSSSTGAMNTVGVFLNGAYSIDVVIKLYIPDHSHKLIGISEKTSVRELIDRAVPEFFQENGVPTDYVVSMVTVHGPDAPIKNSRVAFTTSDLFNYVGLSSRLYLRPTAHLDSLIAGDVANQMVKEGKIHKDLLNLDAMEIAHEMTRKQSEVYQGIDPAEFVNYLYKLEDSIGIEQIEKFQQMTSLEPFWVITTVVSEANLERRVKIIKKMIKVAKHCRELKNYNTAFAIMSGLNSSIVLGLRITWEKVPTRHKRLKEEMEMIFDPSRNMARYRSVVKAATPPLVPLFPLIMKDLTFFHEGMKSRENGLINFEKLRLLAREIRQAKAYCSKVMEPPNPALAAMSFGPKPRTHSIGRMRGAKLQQSLNLGKLHEQLMMRKRVQAHLSDPYIVQDDRNLGLLLDLRLKCDEDTTVRRSKLTGSSSPNIKRSSYPSATTTSAPSSRRSSTHLILPGEVVPTSPPESPHVDDSGPANGSAHSGGATKVIRTTSVPVGEEHQPALKSMPRIKQSLLPTPPLNRKK